MPQFNPTTNRAPAKRNNKACTYQIASGEQISLTPQTVKDYLVNGGGNVTDQEIMMFMALCKSQKLNPFTRDAYLIKYGNQPAAIVVGKGALEKRAEINPNYDGKTCGIIILQEDGRLEYRRGAMALKGENVVGGWCDVYRKDRTHPEHVEVSFDEYVGRKKDGQINGQWTTKPATMIQKVAVAQALRQAFPNDLNAMYSQEEMDQATPMPPLTKPVMQPEVVVDDEVLELEEPVPEPMPQPVDMSIDPASLV